MFDTNSRHVTEQQGTPRSPAVLLALFACFAIACETRGDGVPTKSSPEESRSGDAEADPSSATPTSASGPGAVLYQTPLGLAYSDLGSGTVIEINAPESDGWMGYEGGAITDIEKDRAAGDDAYRVRLRSFDGARFVDGGVLPSFQVPAYTILNEPARPSPDHSKLALVRREQREREDSVLGTYVPVLTVLDLAANIVFTREGASSAIWLSNDRLAVGMEDGLFVLHIGTGARARIGSTSVGPWPAFLALSPDASTLAFVRDDSVWRIGLDGSGLMPLTLQSLGQRWLAWSPDGATIAVVYGSACNSGVSPSVKTISATKRDQDMMRADFLREGVGRTAGNVRTCGPPVWLP